MKKNHFKYVILLVLFLKVIVVTAQEYEYVPFPDSSNVLWSEMYWKSISEPPPSWVYRNFKFFDEDTIINGIKYHKLFISNNIEITRENAVCLAMIREDSTKKVWMRNNTVGIWPSTNENGEYLLYDFNLKEGDTIDKEEDHLFCQSDKIILDSIRYITISNKLRKIYYFNYRWEIWIEGIGKIKGVVFRSGDLLTNGMDNDLICFHQNDTLLYYNSGPYGIYDDCVPSFVLNDVPVLSNKSIKVYPNPATEGIICFENLEYDVLELFDSNGNKVESYDIAGQENYSIDVSRLTKGVYVYRLNSKGFIPVSGKVVVQ